MNGDASSLEEEYPPTPTKLERKPHREMLLQARRMHQRSEEMRLRALKERRQRRRFQSSGGPSGAPPAGFGGALSDGSSGAPSAGFGGVPSGGAVSASFAGFEGTLLGRAVGAPSTGDASSSSKRAAAATMRKVVADLKFIPEECEEDLSPGSGSCR